MRFIEKEGRWRWSKETYMEKKDEILVFKKTKNSPLFDQNGNKSEWNIYTKRYLNDAIEKCTIKYGFKCRGYKRIARARN